MPISIVLVGGGEVVVEILRHLVAEAACFQPRKQVPGIVPREPPEVLLAFLDTDAVSCHIVGAEPLLKKGQQISVRRWPGVRKDKVLGIDHGKRAQLIASSCGIVSPPGPAEPSARL